jgi:hypothetical protein
MDSIMLCYQNVAPVLSSHSLGGAGRQPPEPCARGVRGLSGAHRDSLHSERANRQLDCLIFGSLAGDRVHTVDQSLESLAAG